MGRYLFFIILVVLSMSIRNARAEDGHYAPSKYWFFEVTQSIKIRADEDWVGATPTSMAIGRAWVGKTWYLRAALHHQSNIARGFPFNNKPESWMETGGITLGVRW